jgi:hypothetical protein
MDASRSNALRLPPSRRREFRDRAIAKFRIRAMVFAIENETTAAIARSSQPQGGASRGAGGKKIGIKKSAFGLTVRP